MLRRAQARRRFVEESGTVLQMLLGRRRAVRRKEILAWKEKPGSLLLGLSKDAPAQVASGNEQSTRGESSFGVKPKAGVTEQKDGRSLGLG